MKNHIIIIVAFLFCLGGVLFGQVPAVTSLSADQVMARVFAQDTMRDSMGGGYSGSREYVLDNQKWNKRAEMQVSVLCSSDGTKHFEVVSEDGWHAANKHVLHQMLKSESETSQPTTRPMTRMVPENYEF